MKIQFDYNEVSSDAVKAILDYFYKQYKEKHLEFGSINMYITVRNKEDNSTIGWFDKKTGKETGLYIKSKPMKKSKKPLIDIIEIEQNEKAYVYLK